MPISHTLHREQLVRRPRAEVFAFFSDASNLEAITPDSLRLRILTPTPIAMREGTEIDYQLSLFGLPFRWRSRIDVWEPGSRFVDVQVRGPYRLWHHTHEFAEAPEGTLVRDTVRYELPLGPLGELAHALLVRRQVEGIFAHRRRRIEALLEPRGPRLLLAEPAG